MPPTLQKEPVENIEAKNILLENADQYNANPELGITRLLYKYC